MVEIQKTGECGRMDDRWNPMEDRQEWTEDGRNHMTNEADEQMYRQQPEYDWKITADAVQREGRKIFSRIGVAFAVFLGVTIAAQAGLSALFYFDLIPSQFVTANTSVLLSMVSMYGIAFPIFWLLLKRIPKVEKVERQTWSTASLAVVFLISMATIYIGNIIGQLLMFGVSLITGEPMVNDMQDLIMNMDIPVIFLFTVIVAPVMEELMYRKLLIDRIRQYGEGISVVLSGVLFGLAHGNFYQFFYAFALGVIFAYIYIKSGNVKYTIVFHMIINFIGGIFPMLLLNLMKHHLFLGSLITVTFGLFVLGFLGVGIGLFIMNRKKIHFQPGLCRILRGRRFRTVVGNVGMIVYFVVCIVMFAFS